jgi:Glycosyl transferase family 2
VPVYNGIAQGLPQLLASLDAQTHRNRELIAVDSGSTDGSGELLAAAGATVISISQRDFRHDYARNLGAQRATGDYLLFTVCDCRFSDPRWIELGLRQLMQLGAISYSTPQCVDEQAKPYARFLAWNFLAANDYREGVNVLGHRRLGRLAYRLGGGRARMRAIHVDDTNHLVRADFFRRHPYDLPTCEDMGFGAKLICSNELFLYSTLSHVRHYHAYDNYRQYFSRVFVDLGVIDRLVRASSEMPCRDGIVDGIVAAGATVLDAILRVLGQLRDQGVIDVDFSDLTRQSTTITSGRIVDRFRESLTSPACLLFQGAPCEGSDIIAGQIGLAIDASRQFAALASVRARMYAHVTRCCEVLSRHLGYTILSLDELKHFVILSFMSIFARDLALAMLFLRDDKSQNVARLRAVRWQ